jgi:hypothetical protein
MNNPRLLIAAAMAVCSITGVARADELANVRGCLYSAFHGRHLACFDSRVAKLSTEQRSDDAKALGIQRETAALLDRQGTDLPASTEQQDYVLDCGDNEFFRRHADCFDRRIVKIPAEQRRGLDANFRETLAGLDRSESDYYRQDFGATAAIGMTAEQVKRLWGPPNHINRTATSSLVREQWVYDDGYLYFDDNRLIAIQTRGAR